MELVIVPSPGRCAFADPERPGEKRKSEHGKGGLLNIEEVGDGRG